MLLLKIEFMLLNDISSSNNELYIKFPFKNSLFEEDKIGTTGSALTNSSSTTFTTKAIIFTTTSTAVSTTDSTDTASTTGSFRGTYIQFFKTLFQIFDFKM